MINAVLIISGILCVLSTIGFFVTSVIQTIKKNNGLFVASLIFVALAIVSGSIFANIA